MDILEHIRKYFGGDITEQPQVNEFAFSSPEEESKVCTRSYELANYILAHPEMTASEIRMLCVAVLEHWERFWDSC